MRPSGSCLFADPPYGISRPSASRVVAVSPNATFDGRGLMPDLSEGRRNSWDGMAGRGCCRRYRRIMSTEEEDALAAGHRRDPGGLAVILLRVVI